MASKGTTIAKRLIAFIAGVRSFASMNTDMNRQCRSLNKFLSTFVAFIRSTRKVREDDPSGIALYTRMYSFCARRGLDIGSKWGGCVPCRTKSDLLANVFWQVVHTKSRVSGIDATEGRPLGTVDVCCALRAGGSVVGTAAVDKVGADAVDFGDPGTELDLSDSDPALSAGSSFPVPSLFKIFLMSIHSLRPLQAGSPASNARNQFLFHS